MSPTLDDYPFDWSGLEDFSYPRDPDGVPLVEMGGKLGRQYNPITIAQFGLSRLQSYSESGEPKALQEARVAAAWLLENFQNWRGDIGAWVYSYDLDFYGPRAPWISGMAQAQGISLLLRIQELARDARIPETTRRAFQAFLHPIADGGVLAHYPDGTPVFEEFTTATPSLVLNGHMFALLGIYDYARYLNDAAARELFDLAAAGLIENLPRYDTGCWNLYDLHPSRRLASPMYMLVHVRLLRILAHLSGRDEFDAFADKWFGYRNSPFCCGRWLIGKTLEKFRLRDFSLSNVPE